MKVAFRVDASTAMGSGHLMRCLTLADALRALGWTTLFITRPHPGNLITVIEAHGHTLATLEPPAPGWQGEGEGGAHSAWLGTDWKIDATETVAALAGDSRVDWLIVDHYALDYRWEGVLRPYVGRLMAIDDLADRPHDCDLLLDQNLFADPKKYDGLVSEGCRVLLGPRFALLREEFAIASRQGRSRDGHIKRILVFCGGSDPGNLTEKILDALSLSRLSHCAVDVVVGSGSPHLKKLQVACESGSNRALHVQTNEMAGLMAAADLAIGAPGSASWERCSLGLPALLWNIADNQRDIGGQLASKRAAICLGDAAGWDVPAIVAWLDRLASRPGLLRRISERARTVADTCGTRRVTAALGRPLKLSIVSDAASWLNPYLELLKEEWRVAGHEATLVHTPSELDEGDCAFFLSCGQIVGPEILARHANNLVVHASALPQGRGWSPLTWQILAGKNDIPISLFEATPRIDRGAIYLQHTMHFRGDELVDELRKAVALETRELCRHFLACYPEILPSARRQGGESSYYPRRRAEHSRLDPDASLRSQFNLLRVVDNDSYPAFFDLGGSRYLLKIYRTEPGSDQ